MPAYHTSCSIGQLSGDLPSLMLTAAALAIAADWPPALQLRNHAGSVVGRVQGGTRGALLLVAASATALHTAALI
jgi:hypothetical protein